MTIMRIGVDLAKNVFDVHGVDEHEKPALRKTIKRADLLPFFVHLPPCIVAMESCGSAHYWARELIKLGHTVKLIAPQFVAPYRKGNKNDQNDAQAICEAASRPDMRFVAIKRRRATSRIGDAPNSRSSGLGTHSVGQPNTGAIDGIWQSAISGT